MEFYLSRTGEYLINVAISTFNQLIFIFGILLILITLLSLSANLVARLSVRFWGRNLFLYGFSWLGTSVHELSHAFFALVFGHKITEIVLFEPNKDGASLGHVNHSYNKNSIYQKTGNFFIGIGPVLASGIALFFATWFIFHYDMTQNAPFRMTTEIFSNFPVLKQDAVALKNSLFVFYNLVFSPNSTVWWKVILYIYILYSIGSSMTLSSSDIRSSLSGFLWVIVFFLLFNLFTFWIGNFMSVFLLKIAKYIAGFLFLLLLALLTNLVFIVGLFILNLIKGLFVSRK
ncbi:MAG: M50 family metallopeptidase [Mariniphaga sp.]